MSTSSAQHGTSRPTFVVVGAGLAGARAATTLRERGFDGRVVLVGDEPDLPYERPPLSKTYLAGASERADAYVRPEAWYHEHDVELWRGVRATSLDVRTHRVGLADGRELRYDRLLLATGSEPRRIPVPGADADGVLTLRRLPDSDRLRDVIAAGGRLVVIGAGWIGLEVAAVAREAGLEVTVLEAADVPLARVLGPEMGRMFADLHREHGVDLRLGAGVAEVVARDGHAVGVRLADGTVVEGAVLMATGAAPRLELAREAGLEVDDGVVVDAHLTTSDPDVFAAGDIASAWHPVLGRRLRVEHWATALNQGPAAAASMLGADEVYDHVPYFFTDQYDLGMEYTGHAGEGAYDRVVVRGDVDARELIAFWLDDGRVVAAMAVNTWGQVPHLERLVTSGRRPDVDRLTDPAQDLATL